AVAITFVGLIVYCWLGCAARAVVHEIGQKWEGFQSQFKSKDQSPQPAADPPPPTQQSQPYIPPYVPPYERLPENPISTAPSASPQNPEIDPASRPDICSPKPQQHQYTPLDSWPFGPPAPPPNS